MEDIMLFYSFGTLDEFIENDLIASIQSESNRLEQIMLLYENKRTNLDDIATNLINTTSTLNKNKLDEFYSINNSLKNCFEDLEGICNLAEFLKDSLINIISLHDKNIDYNYNEIKAELIEYNKKSDQLYRQIFDFENKLTSVLDSVFQISSNQKKFKKGKSNISSFSEISASYIDLRNNIEVNHEDNNHLLISEKEQKAYLPYKYEQVKKTFLESKNKYKTMQDVINSLYILPLNKFKNSSIARFREAFYLVRQKEKGSITKALDLGLELMFKYELNPIIIAACRNLDELDIYLDCLDENEPYEFNCFEIKFEVSPKDTK